jgi:hypothetical protein
MLGIKISLPIKKICFCKGVFFIAILLIGFLFEGCMPKHSGEKHINIVFRFDDFSAISSTEFELKIIESFRKCSATLTIGVIPFECAINQLDLTPQDIVPLTTIKADVLKNAISDGSVDVALHGYSHQTISTVKRTEFSGLDYQSQLDRLEKGKKFLEDMLDVPIQVFVPPFNQYDLNTLRALEELHFTTISAYKGGEIIRNSKLKFLPATCGLARLKDAVKAARISSQSEPIIVVLFHDYDFKEIDKKYGAINYKDFSDLLTWARSQDDLRLLSISQATEMIQDLGSDRFIADKWIDRISRFLPICMQKEEYTSGYLKSDDLLNIVFKVSFFYFTIFSFGIIVSFTLGFFIFRKITIFLKYGAFGYIVLSIISLIYTFLNLQVIHQGLIASSAFIGCSIGIFICFLYFKKKSLLY